MNIDLQPALDDAYKTQEEWISLYNSQQGEFQGKRMISAPDIVRAPEHVSPLELARLQQDGRRFWIVTSTHISYQPDSLAGVVTHNYGSTVAEPKEISLDNIPDLTGRYAVQVVKMPGGLAYLNALVDGDYTESKLLQMFSELARMDAEKIIFWTPDQHSRKFYAGYAVRFFDFDSNLHVGGDDPFSSCGGGHSRGVLIDSPS